MANVRDVAAYILREQGGSMTAMKLEKLAYYSQAWHLVWAEEPLFPERFEAWANGPVAPELYKAHRGRFTVDASMGIGDPDAVDPGARNTIDSVLKFYGGMSASALSELTHRERPWLEARGDTEPGAMSRSEITTELMADYYGGLYASEANG